MPGNRATLLITNPGSRSGSNDLGDVQRRLGVLGEVVTRCAESPEQLPQLIREYAANVDRVVIGGGDGTINLALDALIETDLPLGILPLGTANDLARSLEIPTNLEEAVKVILNERTRPIDVAQVNDRSFVNAIGMGLGPRMTRELDSQSKASLGVFAYPVGVARALRTEEYFNATVRADGRDYVQSCVQITVANGIHYGGGMTIAYDAKLDDGQLDVVLVHRQGRMGLLADALRLRSGETRTADNITHLRCSELTVETDAAMEVTGDGEPLTRTPIHCRSRRHALRVYAAL